MGSGVIINSVNSVAHLCLAHSVWARYCQFHVWNFYPLCAFWHVQYSVDYTVIVIVIIRCQIRTTKVHALSSKFFPCLVSRAYT